VREVIVREVIVREVIVREVIVREVIVREVIVREVIVRGVIRRAARFTSCSAWTITTISILALAAHKVSIAVQKKRHVSLISRED
jgi:hypothetical protein